LIFTCPANIFHRKSLQYKIPFREIWKVSLREYSSYKISLRDGSFSHFPFRILKSRDNEKHFFEALQHLNQYYLRQPGVKTTYDPPTIFYSPKADVRELRGKAGKILFSVKGNIPSLIEN